MDPPTGAYSANSYRFDAWALCVTLDLEQRNKVSSPLPTLPCPPANHRAVITDNVTDELCFCKG